MDDVDPEILFAATIGVTLARMRAELDEAAIKRVLIFALERWGVDAPALYIRTVPKARIVAHPTVHDVFPEPPALAEDTPPSNRIPIHSATCPICGKTAINAIGLNTHMHKTHGTTVKEYERTRALGA